MVDELYNSDGELVEGALSGDELKALQEKAASAEKVGEYETKITELEEAKAKLEAKDMNFSKLRGKSKEERDLLMAEWSDEKKEMANLVASMGDEISEFKTTQLSSYKNEVLNAIAGEDDEYKTKIIETAKEMLNQEPSTKEGLLSYYKNAATLIKGARPEINPVNSFVPIVTSTSPEKKGKDWTQTAEGEANYNSYFPK